MKAFMEVNEEKCTGCGTCVPLCCGSCIEMRGEDNCEKSVDKA